MCLGVCLPVCLCTHAWLMLNRLVKGTGFSGTAVTDSCAHCVMLTTAHSSERKATSLLPSMMT